MKKITIKEFQALVARPDWVAEMEQILVERLEDRCTHTGDTRLLEFGFGIKKSKLDELTITYEESYSYYADDEDSFNSSCEGMEIDDIWCFEGVTVVDDRGIEVGVRELVDCLDEWFVKIDYECEFE